VRPRRRLRARAAPRRPPRHHGPARVDPAHCGVRLRARLASRAGDARGGDRRRPGAAGPRSEADVMRRRLAVAFLALPALARAQERKTLAECIEIALHQQPTLRAAAATVAAGRERVWQAAAAYLPQVSASYVASRRHASSSSLGASSGAKPAKTFPFYSTGATLAQAELNQLSARNAVSLGRETLRNVLGLMGPLDFDIVDSLEQPRTEVSDEEALDLAYANRPELRSLAAQERADIERIKAIEKD